jgi:uncharacterized membrane protein YqjE
VASRPAVPIDPDAGIPDLIRRLVDDSRRLAQNEVRLAKIELRENARDATRGGIWLGIAFGAGVVALVGLTILLATLFGGLLGNLWAGTLLTAVLWLGSAYLLVTRGLKQITEQEFTLPETRREAKETVNLLKTVREPEVLGSVAVQAREVKGALTGSPQDLQAVVDRLRAEDRANGNGAASR